ncbi:MAG: hypothetical protein J6Y78_01725 [Paludibacteraceae bacterium]|nr:hypothetical protein [Paludibacteraceae bacterium]
MEEWKDIKGYEGLYQVSNLGNVRGLHFKKGNKVKNLKLKITRKGYSIIGLSKNKKKKFFIVSRLVAEAFIPNPENKPCIDHIIPISCGGTNEATNLRWCTHPENMNNPITKNNISESKKGWKMPEEGRKRLSESRKGIIPKAKPPKKVYQYTLDNELVKEWESISEASRNGYSLSAISQCCNNKFHREGNNIYKGHKWSFEPL